MADNVKIDPGDGPDTFDVATDEVDGVHHPLYKIEFGVDGEATLVGADNPLPVVQKLTYETDSVIALNEISRKLDILIEYQAMLHGIKLGD